MSRLRDELLKRMREYVPPGEEEYGEDSAVGKAKKRLQQDARSYEAAMPRYRQLAETSAGEALRGDLARRLAGVRRNAQSRGLLYSGLRQGAEAGEAARTAGQLAQSRAGINEQLQGGLEDRKRAAMQAGIQQAQARGQYMRQAAELDAQKRARKKSQIASIAGGGFSLLGSLLPFGGRK